MMSTEEMKNNVEKLHELSKNLEQALVELEVWGLGVLKWGLMIQCCLVDSGSWFCIFLTSPVK